MDSNQLSEISHPLDKDMIDLLRYDKSLVTRLKYANFSMSELETAGIAISHNNYIEKYRTAIVRSEPCDPSILGVIGDFVIQVDGIDVCVIFNEQSGGYKLSVRSCSLEASANDRSGQQGIILARLLEKFTKVFTAWNYEAYMSGVAGDMLCYTDGDSKDVYVVKREIFDEVYAPAENV